MMFGFGILLTVIIYVFLAELLFLFSFMFLWAFVVMLPLHNMEWLKTNDHYKNTFLVGLALCVIIITIRKIQTNTNEANRTLIKWVAAIVIIFSITFITDSKKSKPKKNMNGIVKTVNTSNIRSQPSTKSEVLGTAPNNSELNVIEDNGSWVKIEYTDQGKTTTGWISKSLLEKPQ